MTVETPDFNSLSEEAFAAGTGMLDIWQGLEPAVKVEVLPHLVDHIKASITTPQYDPVEIKAMAEIFKGAGEALQDQSTRAEEEAAYAAAEHPTSYGG